MISSLCPVSDALDDLDQLGGWRAMFVLPPEASDADALVGALPWVEGGAPRPGTVVRVFKVGDELILVTGGTLTSEEGASLFDIHENLKDVTSRVLIVPPADAEPQLIDRMYTARVAPNVPGDKPPATRLWAGLAAVILTFAGVMVRFSQNRENMPDSAKVLLLVCAGWPYSAVLYGCATTEKRASGELIHGESPQHVGPAIRPAFAPR